MKSAGLPSVLVAAISTVFVGCDAGSAHVAAISSLRQSAAPIAPDGDLAACREERDRALVRIAELETEVRREREVRLERERQWLRYTQGMARLTTLAGAPVFTADVPAEEREARALDSAAAPVEVGTPVSAAETPTAAIDDARATQRAADELLRNARLAREERSRAVHLALRSLFAIEHVSGLDLLESGLVQDGATGPVVLRVIDEFGRPLGSLYAERLKLEGSRTARTLALILEQGWERRGGVKTPFEGATPDAEGRGGTRRIDLAHVDPTPWFEAVPELFREDQRAQVTQGDSRELNVLRFELNRRFRADSSGPVYRIESLSAREGLVLREVHVAVLTPDFAMERELFADRMSVIRADKGLEIELLGGSQIRGNEKVPFLDGRYRIFLPRADAAIWEAAGIPVGGRTSVTTPAASEPANVPPGG